MTLDGFESSREGIINLIEGMTFAKSTIDAPPRPEELVYPNYENLAKYINSLNVVGDYDDLIYIIKEIRFTLKSYKYDENLITLENWRLSDGSKIEFSPKIEKK